MYDISKFKLAFPLCKEQKVISKFHILAEKFHFKQLNFFKAHPVDDNENIAMIDCKYYTIDTLITKNLRQVNISPYFI